MTRQEIFDRVCRRAFRDAVPVRDSDYRSILKVGCRTSFVGACIDDDEYFQLMDSFYVRDLRKLCPYLRLWKNRDCNLSVMIRLLERLQRIYFLKFPRFWLIQLIELADSFELSKALLEELELEMVFTSNQ